MVQACPECDSSQTRERDTREPRWRCYDCGHEFDEPIERGRKSPGAGVGSKMATSLLDADPDIITNRRKA